MEMVEVKEELNNIRVKKIIALKGLLFLVAMLDFLSNIFVTLHFHHFLS